MKIATKVTIGYLLMAFLVLVTAGGGYWGVQRLSLTLDDIIGPSWDTADGAMEGTIMTQQQILAINRIATRAKLGIESDPAAVTEARGVAAKAFGRMLDSGKLSAGDASAAREAMDRFAAVSDQMLAASNDYARAFSALQANSSEFVAFMGKVEDIGDAAVEDLEKSPNRALTWRQIAPRWQLADGAMESRIAMLSRLHEYSRMAEEQLPVAEARNQLAMSMSELKSATDMVQSSALFTGTVSDGAYAGQGYSLVLEQLLSEHETLMAAAVDAFENYLTVRASLATTTGSLLATLEDLEGKADAAVEGQAEAVVADEELADTIILAATLVSLVVTGIVILLSKIQISRPLAGVARSLREIGEGDGNLNVSLDASGKDELAEIARGFNSFVTKIRETVITVSGSSSQLGAAAEELSAITEQSVQGVMQQTSEIEQTATAMNEMAATVQEVARNAAQASDSAREAQEATHTGQAVVRKTVDAIGALAQDVEQAATVIQRVGADSESITAILDVIKGVAEQTNLLALNAAIEAARAGEQGRGFAVVADEVRTLASRTQDSTQEIEAMIGRLLDGARQAVDVMNGGRTRAEEGVGAVKEAGQALEQITRAVNAITDMNAQIATAAEEQSAVAEEINRNIVNINQLAEQSAESSQQTAAASNELSQLATGLNTVVGQFRT